mmetsp:Transcript_23929/g.70564  ORF Transcript_23929/g.70564 Transcript_23929/m.70564 type:complete len:258 (-) Transcript_23929:968-1741(-)
MERGSCSVLLLLATASSLVAGSAVHGAGVHGAGVEPRCRRHSVATLRPSRRAALALRGGADTAAASASSSSLWAWFRVLLRVAFPGNPPRERASIAPPPPPPSAPPASAKSGGSGSKGFTAKGVRGSRAAKPSKGGSVVAVHSKADFDRQLSSARSSQLVVADFFASWCGPCQQIAPKYKELAAALPHVKFLKVDVDECKDVSQQYGVSAMPTFKMFRAGAEVGSMQGADEGALRDKVESLAGKPDRWASAGAGRKL